MSIFSYPIEITVEELKNERAIDLVALYGANGVRGFLSEVFAAVYDGCIYATGDRDIKDRIIENYKDKAENAIKRALILQAAYMEDEGNVGTASGITISADGQKAVVSKNDLRSKTICTAAVDALKACSVPLLYAGEDY